MPFGYARTICSLGKNARMLRLHGVCRLGYDEHMLERRISVVLDPQDRDALSDAAGDGHMAPMVRERIRKLLTSNEGMPSPQREPIGQDREAYRLVVRLEQGDYDALGALAKLLGCDVASIVRPLVRELAGSVTVTAQI